MQPQNNEPKQTKLFKLTEHIGNTTQLLLEIAKSMLRNGKKLLNSNLVLRKYVANDLTAATIKSQFKSEVPTLARDLEVLENLVNKYRLSAGIENKAKIDQYYDRLERLSREAKNYEAKRQILQERIAQFIKEHPNNIQKMIDKMQENTMATPMTNADPQKVEKDKNITLTQFANEVGMLKAECKEIRAQAQMLQSNLLAQPQLQSDLLAQRQQPGLSNDPNAVPKYDE